MIMNDLEIRPFYLRSASERDYVALSVFKNILQSEVLPDDPPIPYEENIQKWRTLPEFVREATWAAWDKRGDQIVAFGEGYIYLTGDNEDLINSAIALRPPTDDHRKLSNQPSFRLSPVRRRRSRIRDRLNSCQGAIFLVSLAVW